MSRVGRIHRAPLAVAALVTLLVGVGGGAGVYFAADRQEQSTTRVEMNESLAANDGPAENFLIVGSDLREETDESGSRSDSIMILRRDPAGGAALLSIPRDLWVPIAGTGDSGKINWAFNGGGPRLTETITQALGIPIHHYIEIDFDGFSRLVDSFGGVDICIPNPAQDTGSGLSVPGGCQTLHGPQALAFVRSRHYEEWIDDEGDWVPDGKNDLGRIERQQAFIRAATQDVMEELKSNPFLLGNLLEAARGLVSFDENLDLLEAAESLRAAFQEGLRTFQLPVVQEFHGDQDALDLADGADVILEYFIGTGPLPPDPTTQTTTAATVGDAGD
jgi:LCP family protein required for cell wall assembly